MALTPWLNHSWHVPLYVNASVPPDESYGLERVLSSREAREPNHEQATRTEPVFLFDLDGTLVDRVYQHVEGLPYSTSLAAGAHTADARTTECAIAFSYTP